MNKSLKDLYLDALLIQDACNLSGVVHSFSSTMSRLREILSQDEGFSTEKLNRHPIAILYSSKISSLTGSEVGMEFVRAYDSAKEVVNREVL